MYRGRITDLAQDTYEIHARHTVSYRPQYMYPVKCTYRKRMFDWGGAQWRYRIIQLKPTQFCIQVGVPAGDEVETNEDDEIDLGELFKPSLDAPNPSPKKKAGAKAKPADAAAAEPSPKKAEPAKGRNKRPKKGAEPDASPKPVQHVCNKRRRAAR